jgi:hypothetical protein
MRQMVRLALHDHRVEVQWEGVDSPERDGRSDMIPVLKELAESIPGPNATERRDWGKKECPRRSWQFINAI